MKEHDYELLDAPSGDNPLNDEIARRVAFVDDLTDTFLGTAIPMTSMSTLLRLLDDIEDPADGKLMPVLVGVEPVAVCVYVAEANGWYIRTLLRKRPELSYEDALLGVIATFAADAQRVRDAEQRWPKP